MNILQLCNNTNNLSNFGTAIEHTYTHKIINKYEPKNISIVSYDAFIITIDFLTKNYDTNKDFFDEILKSKKNIIFIYDEHNDLDDLGLKIISKKYKIDFQLADCAVLDTQNWNYKPITYDRDNALSMSSMSFKGYCNVKNTKQAYILKKNNIVIMHDLSLRFKENSVDVSGMSGMIKFLLQNDNEEESIVDVDWLNQINILDDKEIEQKIKKNETEINKLIEDKKLLKEKIESNNYYKTILFSSGDKLVEVTKKMLEEVLKVPIDDIDLKKQDLYLKIKGINVLIEIKGVNHPFKRENISQTSRHVKDFAELNNIYGADVEKLCKGVLILNPYCQQELKDKISKEFYSKEVISDAEYDRICTLDTLTFLNYFSKWKENPKSIDFKKILLENNYNKPDFEDIILK